VILKFTLFMLILQLLGHWTSFGSHLHTLPLSYTVNLFSVWLQFETVVVIYVNGNCGFLCNSKGYILRLPENVS
jgi:hypothetical protein